MKTSRLRARGAALALVVLPLAATGQLVPSATALGTIDVGYGVTDNYKAPYNADPDTQERRTYLQLHGVSVGGVTYTPKTLPPNGQFSFPGSVTRTSADGDATMTLSVPAPRVDSASFRVDWTGTFGPFVTVHDPASLQAAPIPVTLTISRNGTAIATRQVDYRYDASLANAPKPDPVGDPHGNEVEWNGPGGRWWFGCTPTRTDWETSAPPAGCVSAPDLTTTVTGPGRVVPGDTGVWTFTVTNQGDADAPATDLDITLPSIAMTQSVAAVAGITCTGVDDQTCTVGPLAAGASRSFTMRIATLSNGPVTITGATQAVAGETATGNNSATWSRIARGYSCSIVGTPGRDTLVAPDENDVLCGLDGNDVLRGGAGPDVLLGGDGNDTLRGNGGNDALVGGGGDDDVDGGAGRDTVSYEDAPVTGIVINLPQRHSWDATSPASVDRLGYDVFAAIEVFRGTPFADTVVGNTVANRIEGLAGADTLYGGAGPDQLVGGPGNDKLFGQDGNDRLNGGDHADTLRGNAGADVLLGDGGSDSCQGGGQRGDVLRTCERR